VYHGEHRSQGDVVTVFDSALPRCEGNPRALSLQAAHAVRQVSPCFGWGVEDENSLQLAIALLIDVSGDPDVALRWCEAFASTYVARLPQIWTVPEIDIALWLYCYDNARGDALPGR